MIKKLLFFFVILSAGTIAPSFAQCIPDLGMTSPGISPDTVQNLPPAYTGVAYEADIQFKVPTDTVVPGFGTVNIDSVKIENITGLPQGYSYNCTPASCVFPGGSNGCGRFSGTTTNAGNYPLAISLIYYVRHPQFGVLPPQSQTVNGYKIVVNTSVSAQENKIMSGTPSIDPNPGTGLFKITYQVTTNSNLDVTVYNSIGAAVSKQSTNVTPGLIVQDFDLSDLASGLYFFRIENDGKIFNQKVIKQN